MQVAIERVEGQLWETKQNLVDAIKMVKAIGLLNLFGNSTFRMNREETALYAKVALGIEHAIGLLNKLEQYKIIRYASYKFRYILFDGTDINIEDEVPVKACYFQKGTPRYFEYEVLGEGVDKTPVGDTDGYIQLIFSSSKKVLEETCKLSEKCENAIIFVCFKNTDDLVSHLYQIEKYKYVLSKVLIDKSDKVAINEINNLIDYEKVVLNKSISESLFAYNGDVTWLFKGEEQQVRSLREFNQLLSIVCDDIYSQTPIMNNELFNKHKLSSSISSAKGKFLTALLNQSSEVDFGFPTDKFPPEKTIYYSLLKNTGLHVNGEFVGTPTNEGIMP